MKAKDVLGPICKNNHILVAIDRYLFVFVVYEPFNEVDDIPAHYQFVGTNEMITLLYEDDDVDIVDGKLVFKDGSKKYEFEIYSTERIELK
jgi:hypothetical protein